MALHWDAIKPEPTTQCIFGSFDNEIIQIYSIRGIYCKQMCFQPCETGGGGEVGASMDFDQNNREGFLRLNTGPPDHVAAEDQINFFIRYHVCSFILQYTFLWSSVLQTCTQISIHSRPYLSTQTFSERSEFWVVKRVIHRQSSWLLILTPLPDLWKIWF